MTHNIHHKTKPQNTSNYSVHEDNITNLLSITSALIARIEHIRKIDKNNRLDKIKISEETRLSGRYAEKTNSVSKIEELLIDILNTKTTCIDLTSNHDQTTTHKLKVIQVLILLGLCIIRKKIKQKNGDMEMNRDVIQVAHDLLTQALTNAPSISAFRHVAEEVASLLHEQLEATTSEPATESGLTLPDPVADRGRYELWKDRAEKDEKPLAFLRRVWGPYIDAGAMYYADLRGSTHRKPLDKTLADKLWEQCKDEGKSLSDFLPNKSKQIDRELENKKFIDYKDLSRLARVAQKRKKKNLELSS